MAGAAMFDGIGAIVGSSFERAPWGWGVLALLVTAMVRLWPAMTKLSSDREKSLLEARAADNAELRQRVEDLEQRLDKDRTQHEAERKIDRHRINNLTQCLDALLMLLEVAPDKASEHVNKIKEMRERQAANETVEKAAVQAASITAVTGKAT